MIDSDAASGTVSISHRRFVVTRNGVKPLESSAADVVAHYTTGRAALVEVTAFALMRVGLKDFNLRVADVSCRSEQSPFSPRRTDGVRDVPDLIGRDCIHAAFGRLKK